ncbi:hypothetical protein [uncultured Psychroserpens sp.]|uniref:AbiTii domain-containing protein n=1 Tax=uncultured Psychroserpens sp. TaxID=255436 RepID=UPI0026314A04|nr:hypothetical protein [uncultured Psychroserpens sp.]
MINELITDIAYDKITVSQGLTRAKLIARQIKNDTFKSWLNKELNGYDYEDPLMPEYRKIWAEIHLTAEFPFGRTQSFPVVLSDEQRDLGELLNHHRVVEPIAIVEQNIGQMTEAKAYIHLNGGMVQTVSELYKDQMQQYQGVIRSGQRTIGKAQLTNIVELTKQKLIDTLQDLEEQFPDLDNKYVMNEENDKKAQNIITNNIYGNNNPLNVAAGENITQGDINLTINAQEVEKLKELGVDDVALEELQTIDKENPKGSEGRKGKVASWLGRVTASMTAKGLYENIPELVEFVGNLM